MLADQAAHDQLVEFFQTGTQLNYKKGESVVHSGDEPRGIAERIFMLGSLQGFRAQVPDVFVAMEKAAEDRGKASWVVRFGDELLDQI